MKGYDDYTRAVWDYLKMYNRFKIAVANLQEDRLLKERMLREYAVTIARYGDEPAGGAGELTPTEAGAEQHAKLEKDIRRIDMEIEAIQTLLNKIDRAIAGLDDDSRKVIEQFFFEEKSWEEVGRDFYYTGKWAKNKAAKAVEDIAFMAFGLSAGPVQLSFRFFQP